MEQETKKQQLVMVFQQIIDGCGLTEKEMDCLLNNREELESKVIQAVKELSITEDCADEECVSNGRYYSDYENPKSIPEQVKVLQGLIPGIGGVNEQYLAKIERGEILLPKFAEGWFAIPNWQKHPEIFGKTYAVAVQKVIDFLAKSISGIFHNQLDGKITDKRLRQTAETKKFFAEMIVEQGNPDVLIVPAQFGIVHGGKPTRRARVVFSNNELSGVGLGTFHVGMMLLTCPDRLKYFNVLLIDCSGDEFSRHVDEHFGSVPIFLFNHGVLSFDSVYVSNSIMGRPRPFV